MAALDNDEDHQLERSEADGDYSPAWASLPDVLVIQIYGYLRDHTRLCMACVCKRWKALFYTPSLWRRRRVHFTGARSENKAKRECEYMKVLGRHLKTMSLSFGNPTYRTVKVMALAAETYLKQLVYDPRIRLTEFVLHHLDLEHNWHFWISRNKVVGNLCRLFKRLRYLQTINVISCRVSLAEGCRLLESLARGYAGRTLRILSADDLFQTNILPIRHKRYVNVWPNFKSLTQIYFNYGAVNAEMLKTFGENLSKTLQKLTLSIEKNVSHIVIGSDAWENFSKCCPMATVTFYIYVTGRYYDPTVALVKGIPVSELDTLSWATIATRDDMQAQIPRLLKHVGKTYADTIGTYKPPDMLYITDTVCVYILAISYVNDLAMEHICAAIINYLLS